MDKTKVPKAKLMELRYEDIALSKEISNLEKVPSRERFLLQESRTQEYIEYMKVAKQQVEVWNNLNTS